MLDIYTVAFFGHREIEHFKETQQALEKLIESMMREHEYVEFLVGRNGEFDQLTASTVRTVRNRLDCSNCSLILVLPYMTAEFRDNEASFLEYYDEVEVSSAAEGVHFKSAMQTRNRELVDRAEILVAYCVKTAGGSAYTVKYARKKGRQVILLGQQEQLVMGL